MEEAEIESEPASRKLAIWSFVAGVLGIVSIAGGFFIPILVGIWIMAAFVFAVVAVVVGSEVHPALKKAPEHTRLRQMVEIGRSLGYAVFMTLGILIVFPVIYHKVTLEDRKATDRQAMCANHMRMLGMGLLEYHAEHGNFPEVLRSLEAEGMLLVGTLDRFEKFNRDGSWTYYWKADPTEKTFPLLVSSPIGKKRVVLFTDLELEALPVKEADALIAKSPTEGIAILNASRTERE